MAQEVAPMTLLYWILQVLDLDDGSGSPPPKP